MRRKIKYIEESPIKRTKIFKNKSTFCSFYYDYMDKLMEKHGFREINNVWKREFFKLKKNGERARTNDGSTLHTPKAIKNQKKAWKKHTAKLRKRAEKVKKNKERIIKKVNNLLIKEGYFFKLCSGGYYTLKYKERNKNEKEKIT